MKEIIASTYKIEREIGSGGGGIVYLAEHLRLGKRVILKADKRPIVKTKPEVLRQEVDVLKNLSHSYIPQVYDFFVEDDTVYTVMDYIAGESFDKPLKRNESFTQAQVVKWARQLLEALCYLHSRPPHGILHADIKPANIMLTPENNICLIDFNIALALGAEGAVQVAYSRGYASPEHYRQTPLLPLTDETELLEIATTELLSTEVLETETEVLKTEALTTEALPEECVQKQYATYIKRQRTLDVRSDIYSLGATLYHLLTGIHPATDARKVTAISPDICSPLIAAIIQKAMAPEPDDRYQTAADMLYDFTHLYEKDARTIRQRRKMKITAAVLITTFLLGSGMSFVGLKQMEQRQNAYVLAEYSQNALQTGDVSAAISYALQALPAKESLFAPPYTAQAQKALTDALGVYDLSDGFKLYGTVELPSEPLKLAVSPNGKVAAAFYAYEIVLFNTETFEKLTTLQMEPSALSDMVFVDDNQLLYAGIDGITAYDITKKDILWTGDKATFITASGDGKKAAAIYGNDTYATIYDMETGTVIEKILFEDKKQWTTVHDGFADPETNLFALNQDGSWLAVSFSDGGLSLFNLNGEEDIELYEQSVFRQFDGGFSKQYFAFSAACEDQSVFAVIDLKKREQTGGFSGSLPFLVQADDSGVYIANENLAVAIDPVTGEQEELAYTSDDITYLQKKGSITMVALKDQQYQFFDSDARIQSSYVDENTINFMQLKETNALLGSSDSPILKILRAENHDDCTIFQYDAAYLHDEARISMDDSTVMLYRYDSMRLCDLDGAVIADCHIPNAAQVYDQQYRRADGTAWLEVIYNDGTIYCYSAVDGQMISEEKRTKPDSSLTEEFLLDSFRVVAPLHETPIVYDLETGEEVCQLSSEDYLTYVTQVDDYIITEYITTAGERYGLLLNHNWETLAQLPNLCDIVGKELIFDDRNGNLRKSSIYSLQELLAQATQ